jgi:hypothetical protein
MTGVLGVGFCAIADAARATLNARIRATGGMLGYYSAFVR